MSNTINKEAVLTEREIFDQIVLLQKNLSDSTFLTLVHLSNALGAAGGEELQLSDDQVANICAPFSQREETLHDLLRFYQKMYQDCSERAKQSTDTQNS